MKVQMDPKKIDMDILDQIISKCEDHMVSPFKKKAAVAVEVKPDDSDQEPDDDDKDGLSDDDLAELIQNYARGK